MKSNESQEINLAITETKLSFILIMKLINLEMCCNHEKPSKDGIEKSL